MKLIYTITILIFCLGSFAFYQGEDSINGRVKSSEYPNDSLSTYWINTNYQMCINEGKPPCDCLSQNEIAMFHIDRIRRKIYIQSSVFHFGMETSAEFDFEYRKKDNRTEYYIPKTPPLKDSIVIQYGSIIWVRYNGDKIRFDKRLDKTIDKPSSNDKNFSRWSDIWKRRNVFNSYSLLGFTKTEHTDSSKVFYSYEELKKLILEDKVGVSCSDDYHWNSMKIKGEPNRYFHLEYNDKHVVLHEVIGGRNKGQKLKLNSLEKQILYK